MQLFSFIILTGGCRKLRKASLILNKLFIYFKYCFLYEPIKIWRNLSFKTSHYIKCRHWTKD